MGGLNFLCLVSQKINSMWDSWTDKSQTLLKFQISSSYFFVFLNADEQSTSINTIIHCGFKNIIIKLLISLINDITFYTCIKTSIVVPVNKILGSVKSFK